jgi:hypothetical protein
MPTLLLWCATLAGAADAPAGLVRRLGAPAFAAREEAARELRQLGRAAEGALRAGLSDADPEVRQRCRALLDEILKADRELRLKAFLSGKDDPKNPPLPGWERFARLAGSGPAARASFAVLYRAGPDLLEAAEQRPREAAALFTARAPHLAADLVTPGKDEAAPAEVALLLLVALDDRITLDAAALGGLGDGLEILSQRPALRKAFLQEASSRALLAACLRQRMSGTALERGLELAGAFELKESADWAMAAALDRTRSGPLRGRALLTVAQVGGREHAARLEPLLADETAIGDRKLGSGTLHAQVRDVALAVVIRLEGGQAVDFGFPYLQAVPGLKALPSPTCLGFSNAAERQAAFQKWKTRPGPPKKDNGP